MDVPTYKLVFPFLLKNYLKVMLKINLSVKMLLPVSYTLQVMDSWFNTIVTNRSFFIFFVCF